MLVKNHHVLKNLSIIVILLFISLKNEVAFSQVLNLEFENYDYNHGLPQNNIFAITQDEKGFMWFGTDDGLCRFDGHEFKVFKASESDSSTLLNNGIRSLHINDDGSILVGTINGLCRFYPEKEFFKRYESDPHDPNCLNGSYILDIQKDRNGNLMILYEGNGMDILNPKGEVQNYSMHAPFPYRLHNDIITSVITCKEGEVFLGTSKGMEFLNKNKQVISYQEAYLKYPWAKELSKAYIRAIMLSKRRGQLYIGTEMEGLYVVDLKNQSIRNFRKKNSPLNFDYVGSIVEDSEGNIWIGSEGLYFFDFEKDNLVLYNEFGAQGSKIVSNPINTFFEDKDNNIWIGTARMGVLKYSPFNTAIMQYNTNQGEGIVKSDEILSFNEDELGQVWIGTGNGLFKFRKDLKGIDESFIHPQLYSKIIKSINKDRKGNFWLGTWFGGLLKYHPVQGIFKEYSPDHGNFDSWHTWAVQEDVDGNLWIATLREGLCYFDVHTEEYRYFKNIPGDSTSLIHNKVLSVFQDSQKRLWVGTYNGVSIRYPDEKKFKNLYNLRKNLEAFKIYSFYEDKEGKVWIGTGGGGIIILNPDLSIFKKITKEDGLPSNIVTAIISDNNNNIWVSTYDGLAQINHTTFTLTEIPQVSEIQRREYLSQSAFRSKDGKLFFGGVNGFCFFHPDSLTYDRKNPEIFFTSLKIFDEEILPCKDYKGRKILERAITDTDEINLSYRDYSFTLSFAPLAYNWQKSLKYAYIMENLDNEWHYTSSDRRFVHYSNLSPGTYTLKVKASYDGKSWPENAKILKIQILPPWWGTYSFRFFTIISFVAIFFFIYRGRVSFLKSQSHKLEDLVTLRTQELKSSNEEIQDLLVELAQQKDDIETKNHELQQINEELKAQHDVLELKSVELERAQRKLQEINANLELLVKKRTQKLNFTVRELETLLYRASHDLRGPISSMLGLVSVAKMEHQRNMTVDLQYFDYLQGAVLKLERTLQKLLQKYAITKKKVTKEFFSSTMIEKLLEEVTKDIESYRKYDFKTQIDKDLRFHSDSMLLNIMFTNLLENAFYFSKRAVNKKVILSLEQSHNYVEIVIMDYGAGIKKELKHKVFSMFYRGNEHSTGNGLGLYLVKNCIEKLEGSISLESEEGIFTRFSIRLPMDPSYIITEQVPQKV